MPPAVRCWPPIPRATSELPMRRLIALAPVLVCCACAGADGETGGAADPGGGGHAGEGAGGSAGAGGIDPCAAAPASIALDPEAERARDERLAELHRFHPRLEVQRGSNGDPSRLAGLQRPTELRDGYGAAEAEAAVKGFFEQNRALFDLDWDEFELRSALSPPGHMEWRRRSASGLALVQPE